ncbi:MAG TPA: efflux RND transporter periplasmic adaptor subunit [Bacteroidales bacterium]|nr:efflux RND transporter periplasmic adaptor subunit [Bacteroidales bacterium]
MKKFASLLIVVVFMVSCSNDKKQSTIEKKIQNYKNKIGKINKKINDLEIQLEEMDTTTHEEARTVVSVKDMEPSPFNHYISVNGLVKPVQEAFISPEISGQIEKINVSDGDNVSKGQLLIRLNTDVTDKSIQEVKTNLELARKVYEKQKDLWDQNIGSEVQYLQAKNNKESLEARLETLQQQKDMAEIRAPFSGQVDNVSMKVGEMAMPGVHLMYLVNLEHLKLDADLSEAYINDVKKGEEVIVAFPSFPDMTRKIRISRVGRVIDPKSRTFPVELKFNNPGEKIRANQLATMQINDFSSDSAFVVPSILIKQDNRGYYLYEAVMTDNGLTARKLYVEPGRTYQDKTMVKDGIRPGMQVIVDGYNLVKNGSEIKLTDEK